MTRLEAFANAMLVVNYYTVAHPALDVHYHGYTIELEVNVYICGELWAANLLRREVISKLNEQVTTDIEKMPQIDRYCLSFYFPID